MGIVDNSIPKITYKAGALDVKRPTPYIDDIFDPLFNTEVRNYLYNKYDNNRLLATLGGYAELTDNALFGHKDWGILGPGMGIWSAFGRSMDKADDFILGGITEGVKGLTGQGLENPMTNIFEKDQDYSGTRLLSAMANSFNSLSGGKLGGVTTENDFKGLWNLPALGIDLATDPGIIGGATARATGLKLAKNIGNQTANKTLHEVGSILNQYDDIMAKVAGNVVVPGMHSTISKLMHQILEVVKHRSALKFEDVTYGSKPTDTGDVGPSAPDTTSPPTQANPVADTIAKDPMSDQLIDMANNLQEIQNTFPKAPAVTAGTPNLYDSLINTYDHDVMYLNHLNRIRNANTTTIANKAAPIEDVEAYARKTDALTRATSEQLKLRGDAERKFFDWATSKGYSANYDPSVAMKEIGIEDIPDDVWLQDYAPQLYDIARREATVGSIDKAVPSYTEAHWNVPGEYREVAPVGEFPHMEFFRTPADMLERPNIRPTYLGPKWTGDTTKILPNTTLHPNYVDDTIGSLSNVPPVFQDSELEQYLENIPTGLTRELAERALKENPEFLDTLQVLMSDNPVKAIAWKNNLISKAVDLSATREQYLNFRNRLAAADFENAASYNALLSELGFDPKTRRKVFFNDDNVPTVQESLYTQPELVQKHAVNVASSIYKDLQKHFAPVAAENAEGYAKRLLGLGEYQGTPTAKRLQWLIPDPKMREEVVGSFVRLNRISPNNPMHAMQYVSEVERLAQNLQKAARAVDDPTELQVALSDVVDKLIEQEVPPEKFPESFENLITRKRVAMGSQDPLIQEHLGDILLDKHPSTVRPEVQKAMERVDEERERILSFLVRTANMKLGSKDPDFSNLADAITDFISRTNEDLYKPLHGTAESITEKTFKEALKSETTTTNLQYINELFRQNPQIVKDPEFLDMMRTLTPYYQFHLGPMQNVSKWTNLAPVVDEFNTKLVPQIQEVLNSKGWNNVFTQKPARAGTALHKLQDTLGYFGDTQNRSPYWLELRELMKDQVSGKSVELITTTPQLKKNFVAPLIPENTFGDLSTTRVLPSVKDTIPEFADLNKWNDPNYILNLQRRFFENRINVKSPNLRIGATDIPLDKSLQALYANPHAIKDFMTSDAGRKMYPGFAKRFDSVKAKPASVKLVTEAAVTEDVAETAMQKMSSKEFIEAMEDSTKPTDTLDSIIDQANRATEDQIPGPNSLKAESLQTPPPKPPKTPENLTTLSGQIARMNKSVSEVSSGATPSMETVSAKQLSAFAERFNAKAKAHSIKSHQLVHEFMREMQGAEGSVMHGKDFLVELLASNGRRVAAFAPKDATYKKFRSYLQETIDLVNKQVGDVPFLKLHEAVRPNGNRIVGVVLNTELKSQPKMLTQIYKNLKKVDTSGIADFTLVKPGTSYFPDLHKNELYDDLYRFFSDLHDISSSEARKLGLPYSDALHVKDVYLSDESVAHQFKNVIWNGLDLDEVSDFANQVANQNQFFEAMHGAFYTQRFDNSLMGNILNFESGYDPIFTTDLQEILQGTLAGGAYESKNYQNFTALFSKQFNVHDYMSGPEDIFKTVMPGGSKEFANLHNLVFSAPKYDASGRITGFQRFNILTDAGRKAAWENPETVMLTESVFGPLDTILKRQKRLSNKAFRWISQHITVPYKFGVLTNPGFLLGNLSDAYLKQATTMSQKYGTSVSEELVNVTRSMGDVMRISNEFDTAYEKIVKACDAVGVNLAQTERIPSLALGNKRVKQLLRNIVDGKADPDLITAASLTSKEKSAIQVWTFLHETQGAVTFARNLRDAGDVAAAINKSPFSAPTNFVDRLLRGRGEYDPRDINTWGLFLNNPIAAAMMDGSEDIEHLFRLSSILNDLKHQGTSAEEILSKIRTFGDNLDDASVRKAYMGLQEAIDATANANFDYESSSDFMEAMAHVMPFPTFFLKNIGYWLQMFVENPQYIDNAIDIQNGLWHGKDTEKDEFQAEAKGRGAIPVGPSGVLKNNKLAQHFKGIYKPTPLNSMFGALSAINNPLGDMMFRVHPLAATAAVTASRLPGIKQATTPYMTDNNVQYRPYSTNPYEKNVKFADPNFNALQYALHRFNPMERTLNTALRTPAKIKSGDAQLSDFLPSIFQPDFGKKKKK